MIKMIPGKFYEINITNTEPLIYFRPTWCECHHVFFAPNLPEKDFYFISWDAEERNELFKLNLPSYFQYQFKIVELYQGVIGNMVPELAV